MPASDSGPSTRPLLLLIDDDAISREVTATLLTLGGFAVEAAGDGAEALHRLEGFTRHPVLILADAQMPGLAGLDLLQQLRAHTPAPIAVISGSQPEATLAKAADAVLLKPFSSDAVRQLLGDLSSRPFSSPQPAEKPSGDRPVIRLEVLAQFRGLMPEAAVLQVYHAIVTDLGRRATALETALETGNLGEIGRIGHAIKGGCAMAGAAQAAWLGQQIEEGMAQGNQLDNNRHLPAELRAAAEKLRGMLEIEFPAQRRGE